MQRAQVTAGRRLDPRLHAGRQVAGARAEAGDAGVGGEVPQRAQVRVPGIALVEHDRGGGQQHADQEVPHHPARRREPEDPVVLLGVEVQVQLLEVLEQDPAVPVHDRLRQARRAAGVQDPQGVVERHVGELERLAGALEARLPARAVQVAEGDEVLESSDLAGDGAYGLAPVEVAPAVAVAVDGQQHLGLDLGEAVHDAAGPEVRRAARPHRAEARAGQEARDRLGDVGQVRGDAVARADAERPQPAGDPSRALAQLAPRPLVQLAQLGGVADGHRVVVAVAEHVAGMAEPRAREPLRPRHGPRAERPLGRRGRLHVEVLPDRGPEPLEVARPTSARDRRRSPHARPASAPASRRSA